MEKLAIDWNNFIVGSSAADAVHEMRTRQSVMIWRALYTGWLTKTVLLRLSLVTLKNEQLESKLKMIQKAEG